MRPATTSTQRPEARDRITTLDRARRNAPARARPHVSAPACPSDLRHCVPFAAFRQHSKRQNIATQARNTAQTAHMAAGASPEDRLARPCAGAPAGTYLRARDSNCGRPHLADATVWTATADPAVTNRNPNPLRNDANATQSHSFRRRLAALATGHRSQSRVFRGFSRLSPTPSQLRRYACRVAVGNPREPRGCFGQRLRLRAQGQTSFLIGRASAGTSRRRAVLPRWRTFVPSDAHRRPRHLGAFLKPL